MSSHIYLQKGWQREPIRSLRPFLRIPLDRGMLMDPNRLTPDYSSVCPWKFWGVGKGVTHVQNDISVFAVPNELKSGLHAEMVQGFSNVDSTEVCYDEEKMKNGFGGFIRWVYLSDPKDPCGFGGVFGIDWSLGNELREGIATSMFAVTLVCARARAHGIPMNAEVALLDHNMREQKYLTEWRYNLGLLTVNDWASTVLFKQGSERCPKCGQKTFVDQNAFCFRCGTQPTAVFKGSE